MAKSIALEAPQTTQKPDYYWLPNDEFTMNGLTLEASMHVLGSILSEPEAQKVLALNELYKMYQNIFAEGVKSGKIKDRNVVPEDQNVEADS